jgi:hypothetical protein
MIRKRNVMDYNWRGEKGEQPFNLSYTAPSSTPQLPSFPRYLGLLKCLVAVA